MLMALVSAAACLAAEAFENPLTARPSKDLNTWLLGVWERRAADGKVLGRAVVAPRSADTYGVRLEPVGRGAPQGAFVAWPSRVGRGVFLTLRCEEAGAGLQPGQHIFAHYQVMDPSTVRVRVPKIEAAPESSSYQLRQAVRAQWKSGALLAGEAEQWVRIADVIWSGGGATASPFPARLPQAGGR